MILSQMWHKQGLMVDGMLAHAVADRPSVSQLGFDQESHLCTFKRALSDKCNAANGRVEQKSTLNGQVQNRLRLPRVNSAREIKYVTIG